MLNNKKITTLNSTAIVHFLECPRKYNYASVQALAPKGVFSEAMGKGEIFHHLICKYWQLKLEKHPKPFLAITEELRNKREEFAYISNEDLDFLRQRFFAYSIFWESDPARPLVMEGKLAIEIGFSVKIYEDDENIFILEGRLDRIATQQGIDFLLDHKTQSRKSTYHWRRPQFMNYILGAQIQGMPINKLMVDYIGLQQTIGKDTFRRDMFQYPPSAIKEWHNYIIERIFKPVSLGKITFKERGSCEGTYSPCTYNDLCDAPSDRAESELIELKFERREPHRSW